MSSLQFYQFFCREDNFGVLVYDPASGRCVSIDAPDEAVILKALELKGWTLTDIFVTHWHMDHVVAIPGLKEKYDCHVVGPKMEADKIEGLDRSLVEGDELSFGGEKVRVIATPGHTLGMVNYYFEESGVVFTGDTLFALGCGRLFEGDGPMMWESMQKLAALPGDTQVYCGHEYTLANGKFAMDVDPENEVLAKRMKGLVALREVDKPTLPTTIGEELATNPFMRPGDKAMRAHLGMASASDSAVFTEIRTRKDKF